MCWWSATFTTESYRLCTMRDRNTTLRSRELGHQLRRYREARGLKQHYVAQHLGLSVPSISRIEDGTRAASPEEVAGMLALYGVIGTERDALLDLARAPHELGWWQKDSQSYKTVWTLEPRSCAITSYQHSIIPGLLQTPEYVTALMYSAGTIADTEIPDRVKARLARRHILFRDDPVHLMAIIGEGALHRVYGSTAVQHRQLAYLLKMMERTNVVIRIVPIDRADVRHVESFLLMRFPVGPAIVQTENLVSNLYIEDPKQVVRYDDAVHGLMRAALDTGESAELITRLMRNLEDDPDVLPKLDWPPLAQEQSQQP